MIDKKLEKIKRRNYLSDKFSNRTPEEQAKVDNKRRIAANRKSKKI